MAAALIAAAFFTGCPRRPLRFWARRRGLIVLLAAGAAGAAVVTAFVNVLGISAMSQVTVAWGLWLMLCSSFVAVLSVGQQRRQLEADAPDAPAS